MQVSNCSAWATAGDFFSRPPTPLGALVAVSYSACWDSCVIWIASWILLLELSAFLPAPDRKTLEGASGLVISNITSSGLILCLYLNVTAGGLSFLWVADKKVDSLYTIFAAICTPLSCYRAKCNTSGSR